MQHNYTLYQVDAFAEQLFEGNPAGVVPLKTWLPDATMQAIAAENNLAETAFFIPLDDGFHLRWFTPAIEVDFCGHATLATSHVLFQHLAFDKSSITYQTRVGKLEVKRVDTAYQMNFPSDKLEIVQPVPTTIIEGLGKTPKAVYQGREDYLVVFDSQSEIEQLAPDFKKIATLDHMRGVIATAPGIEHDFVSRCFFPQAGIDEDPVTGSAHTTLTPYWAKTLAKNQLKARQISTRGGNVQCELNGDRVILTGKAKTYLIGTLFI